MANFVMVHGSWQGGWCWRWLTPLLRQAGHAVFTPTLTGLGERSHLATPQTGLTLHIQDIVQVLQYEDLQRTILVGHSYGGMVITGVAGTAPERLARLVYLDAVVPEDGQCAFDLLPPGTPAWWAKLAAANADGSAAPPPIAVFGVTDSTMAAWAQSRLTPMPLLTHQQPIRLASGQAEKVPRSYIACTDFQWLRATVQKVRALGWDYHELPTGHNAMMTMPAELARVLGAIADLNG